MSADMPSTYRLVPGEAPSIDGVPIPWPVAIEPGPMVEAMGEPGYPVHILWLPIIVDAPMPTPPEGRPDGEPILTEDAR